MTYKSKYYLPICGFERGHFLQEDKGEEIAGFSNESKAYFKAY